ncbi:UPF0739 protein C1orf74 homolog isoform X2 [Oncorhynchus keta]|uniref:UPF0739 protein C1orf74 homolog isoform X2 n=1 Tax=Oncorhynchus keta TaxID=8018 RepID=UPI00227BC03F|nr:UPF0739 protein C1orf74 homolog isoform X2 [Oncorhynchus keta]
MTGLTLQYSRWRGMHLKSWMRSANPIPKQKKKKKKNSATTRKKSSPWLLQTSLLLLLANVYELEINASLPLSMVLLLTHGTGTALVLSPSVE